MKVDVKKVKIFVFVPTNNVNDVREVACGAGAGVIGNYSFCTSSTNVVGTFIPNDSANPYIGKSNVLEFVDEVKLEFICDIDKVKGVLSALRSVHPYEEPAIDIVPLINEFYFDGE
jgi:hypothetical protein